MNLDQTDTYTELLSHAKEIRNQTMRDMFKDDDSRVQKFSAKGAEIYLDYSKNRVTKETMESLFSLCEEVKLTNRICEMMQGRIINNTENRAVLHTALRDFSGNEILVDGADISKEIQNTRNKLAAFVGNVHSNALTGYTNKSIDTLVSIGIGGSFLGPKTVVEAARPFHKEGYKCYFAANVDGSDIAETLKLIDPETTLFLIQSKTFTTQETLCNANTAKAWFLEQEGVTQADVGKHFLAVSTNISAAKEFGINENQIFPMWDWVGGRYSLWSAIGLPIAFVLGWQGFEEVLRGAEQMDIHFAETEPSKNLPVILALLGIWNSNFLGAESHAIVPYDEYLQYLPAHLQQLDMESNGKQVNRSGEAISYQTGPIIWGGSGTNGQHAYFQLMHQGTRLIPVDFIVPLTSQNPIGEHHAILFANCLAQSQAMMRGKNYEEALAELEASGQDQNEAEKLAHHKVIPGNKPSNTLIVDELSPRVIGSIIALYEHKVMVQGILWNVNSFDQWGVELGKQLGKPILKALTSAELDDSMGLDASTLNLIKMYQEKLS